MILNHDDYLQNANDSDLRQLYIKAFNGRESALSTTLGLQKSVQGGYGFFVSATLARRALRTSLIHARCSLKEIEVKQTFTIVALPMEKNSPYEKIINLRFVLLKNISIYLFKKKNNELFITNFIIYFFI